MRAVTFAVTVLSLVVVIDDAVGQGRGRFGRRNQRPQATPTEAPKEEKKDDKVENWLAITGADVYLGTGQKMTGATVLVGDDKIHGVGHNLTLPEGTKTIDASGKVVCPGFVIVQASGMGAGSSKPFRDSCNPFDPSIKQGLAAGITSFLTGSPRGSGASPGGDTAIVKLAYGDLDGMVLKEGTVVGLSVPLSPQDMDKLLDLVKKVREHEAALEKFTAEKAKEPGAKPPTAPRGAEKLLAVMNGKSRLWISLRGGGGRGRGMRMPGRGGGGNRGTDVTAIRQAMKVAEALGQGVVLQDPVTAWVVPDEIAATGSMVILNPRNRVQADPQRPDVTGSNIAAAAILADVGVPVAVTPPGGRFGGAGVGTGGIMGQDLNTPHVDAAFAVRGGLDNRKALRTITLDAARILGVDSRVGSLEKGKDADILILDGDPLHYKTFVETAIVNGKVVYEKEKEPFYSHIKRQD